jgi:polysaccharide pyruvyl transferase WcaK-like protein
MDTTQFQENSIWKHIEEILAKKGIERPHVVVHGGYGKHNLGDDAILEATLHRLQHIWPLAGFSILCHSPKPVLQHHPNVNAYAFTDPMALKAICTAHLYVIGGGGIVNRINTYSGLSKLKILDPKGKFLFLAGWLSKLCGAYLVFYSVGTTSIPDPLVKWLVKQVMGRVADCVSVRDPRSLTVLREAGISRKIHVLPDPATMLHPGPAEEARVILQRLGIDCTKPIVGLCMRYVHEPTINNANVIYQTARIVEWLIQDQGMQVLFIPFSRHRHKTVENDVAFAQAVQNQRLPNKARGGGFWILAEEFTPSQTKAILGQMDICILERLHACIMTAGVGVPIIAIAYDAKVSEFMKSSGRWRQIIPLQTFSLEAVQAIWASCYS